MQKIVNLAFDRTNFHRRINQAGGTNDLLHHHAGRFRQLIRAGRGGDVDDLIGALFKFFKLQRPIIERRRQAEAILHQVFLARAIAVPHAMQLRNGLVRFI